MLVGIIPITNIKTDFKNPSGFYNLLLAKNLTVIQRCVEECSIVGCDIIYIFAGSIVQKYIKSKYSTYVFDIMDLTEHYSGWKGFIKQLENKDGIQSFINSKSGKFKVIPIIFHSLSLPIKLNVPLKSQILSGFFGAYEIANLFGSFSSSMGDAKFFFSFPQSSCLFSSMFLNKDGWERLKEIRTEIATKPCRFVFGESSIDDGLTIPFTCSVEQVDQFRRKFFKYDSSDSGSRTKKASDFRALSVFKNNAAIEVDNYFDFSTWKGYSDYLQSSSELSLNLFYKDKINKMSGYKLYLTTSFDNAFDELR